MPEKTIQDYTHWKTADGELILVSSLSEEHLRNAVKFVANCLCSYYLSNYPKPFDSAVEIVAWLNVLLNEASRRSAHTRDRYLVILDC